VKSDGGTKTRGTSIKTINKNPRRRPGLYDTKIQWVFRLTQVKKDSRGGEKKKKKERKEGKKRKKEKREKKKKKKEKE